LENERVKRIVVKPANGGVKQQVSVDFNISDRIRSLHDFKFFRNVDADLTKQLANLEVQRNIKI